MSDAREAATAAAFAAHAQAVTALAARVLGEADAARDVCQETFVRFHARQDEVREPLPWLRAVAWRLAFDALRRARRERTALAARVADEPRDVPVAGERVEHGERVRSAVAALSDRQREVVLLRVVDGATFPAVARALQISEGAAKVHLRRALERLRDTLRTAVHLGAPAPTRYPSPRPVTEPGEPRARRSPHDLRRGP